MRRSCSWLLLLVACGTAPGADVERSASTAPAEAPPAEAPAPIVAPPPPAAPSSGARVLEVADRMIADGVVVRGGCYGYVERVFEEAGFAARDLERVFRGETGGPYADLSVMEPGDWLALVNHPERDPVGTHSVIFVEWVDRARGEARAISYVGGDRDEPGAVVTIDVTRTYGVRRAPASRPSVDPSGR